jgi:hypothetical protein
MVGAKCSSLWMVRQKLKLQVERFRNAYVGTPNLLYAHEICICYGYGMLRSKFENRKREYCLLQFANPHDDRLTAVHQ